MTSAPRPLDGVRVVEFSHMVMGPTCGLILADPQFKQKLSYRTDYFAPKPDKAVPKAVPKMVLLRRHVTVFCLVLLWYFEGEFWCPEEGIGSASRHQRLALTLQNKATVSFWFLQQA